MELSFKQISDLTVGKITVKQSDSKISFRKCTDNQIKAWFAHSESLKLRAETTTGIRLDFHTDSTCFKAVLAGEGKFELLIDGLVTKIYMAGETVDVKLPSGDTRVTLVFPSHTVGELVSVEIDDGAYAKAHKYDRKILFIGDSITQGWNSKYDTMSYAWQTTLALNAESVINGVGGGFYDPTTFEKTDFDPDTVVIAYGTNDFGHYKNYEDLTKNTKEFLDLIKSAYGDKKVVCVSPIWREDENTIKPIGDFFSCRDIVEKEITDHGFILVDGYKIVPHNMDYYADALHPNDLGFAVYARNLVNILR